MDESSYIWQFVIIKNKLMLVFCASVEYYVLMKFIIIINMTSVCLIDFITRVGISFNLPGEGKFCHSSKKMED